jgi:predicted GTPase
MKPNNYQLKWSMIGMLFSFTLILFSTCSKQNSIAEDVNSTSAQDFGSTSSENSFANPFHRAVGGKISSEMGKRWIENYSKITGKSFTYSIRSSAIEEILTDQSVDGVVMYYAETDEGHRHILPFGVKNGKRLRAERIPVESGYVSWEEALAMIENHKGKFKSHFFGANTFQRIIRERQVNVILITCGMDERNVNQLLLSSADLAKTETTAIEEEGYEDKSYVCPDLCL